MLLAFDTSTAATVVGVGRPDGTLLAAGRHDPGPGERPGHMSQLLPLVQSALSNAGLSWSDVQRLGVGVGPGGFTGIRVGMATGLALGTSLGVPAVPISSLEALAAGSGGEAILAAIDARRSELFLAAYDAAGDCAIGPFVSTADAIADGSGAALGDGALRYRAELEARGYSVPSDDDPRHRLQAGALVTLTAAGPPAALEPAYLRAPDAQPRQA